MANENEIQPIIKKIKKVEASAAHGGAWKVAYADFVTAMMAFFMLLWLLNVAPPETLSGLADYFAPSAASSSGKSGENKPLNSGMLATPGSNPNMVTAIMRPGPPATAQAESDKENEETEDEEKSKEKIEDISEAMLEAENEEFELIKDTLTIAIQESPLLKEHEDQIIMEITEDGMKIQLIDKDQRSMFRSGTAELYNFAQAMIREIGGSVQNIPNRVTIEGHTDSSTRESTPDYTFWELSSDRANAARRVLAVSGVSGDRFNEMIGKAATDPLYPDRPQRTENRRITITLLRESPEVPPNYGLD